MNSPDTPPVVIQNEDPPRLENGTWEHPYWITAFPAQLAGDTRTGGVSIADTYSCDPSKGEKGPEIIYAFDTSAPGMLRATLDDLAGDSFDLDVHLLDAADAGACLARGNITLSSTLQGSKTYYLAVDTFSSGATTYPGPFTLSVTFTAQQVSDGTCPSDMVTVPSPSGDVCMDRYEAPNVAGEQPLVMFDFNESEAWCGARGKRLCYNDEWEFACAGVEGRTFSWGNDVKKSTCNTKKLWRTTNETLIGQWPGAVNTPAVNNRAALFTAAAMYSSNGSASAAHVESLYQAEGSGAYAQCVNEYGVYDLTGSVEEWSRVRTGGVANFHGSLKGRYWSETRTCQSNITTHADAFRFYEIGFRCCKSK